MPSPKKLPVCRALAKLNYLNLMNMKTTKITYWIVTGLFAAFMTFSAIPDILMVEDAKQFITHLGYPLYFIPFIGWAKLLGSISILIPKFKTVKEWAYAGLFYDLIGATYSNIMVDGLQPGAIFMLLPIGLGVVSYYFNKKLRGQNNH